jgi:hypothetical protein
VVREVWPELLSTLRRELLPVYAKWAETFSDGVSAPAPRSFLELERDAPEMAAEVLNWCLKSNLVGEVDGEPEWHGSDWERVAIADSLWPAMFIYETLWVWSQPTLGSRWLNSDPPDWPHKSRWLGRVGGPRKLAVLIPEPEGFKTKAEYLRQATKGFLRQLRQDLKRKSRCLNHASGDPPNSAKIISIG